MKLRRTIDFDYLDRLARAGATAQVIIEILKAQEGLNKPRAKREGRARQTKAEQGTGRQSKAEQGTPSQIAEKQLFDRAKVVIGKTCGGLVSALVKFNGFNIAAAREMIEVAATKSDPREFVVACMKGQNGGSRNPTMAAFDDLISRAEGEPVADGPAIRDITPRSA